MPQLDELFRTRPESLAVILKATAKDRPTTFPYKTEAGPTDLDETERVIYTSTLKQLSYDECRLALAFLCKS